MNDTCARCRRQPPAPDRVLCPECNVKVLAAAKLRRQNAVRRGVCIDCPRKAAAFAVRCEPCLEHKRSFYHARVDGQTQRTP